MGILVRDKNFITCKKWENGNRVEKIRSNQFKRVRLYNHIMNIDRSRMYQRIVNGRVLPSFVEGVDAFVTFALTQTNCLSGG